MLRSALSSLYSRPYLLLVLTALFWAGNAIAGKMAAGTVPPMTLTCIRWVLTAGILYLMAREKLPESMPLIRRHWRRLALLGALGLAGFNMIFYAALNFTSAINVAIEQSAMPMVIMLLALVVFRERASLAQLVGAALSILGVLVTATRGDLSALIALAVNVGDLMMLGAVLVYAGYSVFLRTKPVLDWRVFMFALSVAAALMTVPFAAVEIALGYRPEPGWAAPLILVYVTLFPSLLAQIFFIRGVELIGANRAGLFINLVPVFGAVLAVILLGEQFRLYHAMALVLVLGGIGLAETSSRRRLAAGMQ